jgi:ComF family protein
MLLAPPLCWSCGAAARRAEPLCRGCRACLRFLGPEPVRLAGVAAWAPLAYEGPARDLVRALKFRAALGVAETMAALMVARAPLPFSGALVPVPLAAERRRRRGFNQAELLARAVASRTGLALADCLARSGRGPPQVGRGRRDRLLGPAGSISVKGRPPERAILVDDVVTTGATLAACATALRAAGSREVTALAFARTPGR